MRIGLGVLALLLVGGCGGGDVPAEMATESSGVEREMHGFVLTETQTGRRAWELHSERAWRLPEQAHVRMEEVELVFFDADGVFRSRLTADHGRVDEEAGEMTATGRVLVVSAEDDTLQTDELVYHRDEDRIRGPGFVRLSDPDRVLTGTGFEAAPDLSDYKVHENVHIVVADRDHVIDEPR